MKVEQAMGVLTGTELFAGLNPDALRHLAECCIERSYKKGHLIFCQGDRGEALYVLVEGRLKVLVTSPLGDEMVVVTLQPPATFGELALVDGQARSASVEVLEAARVLALERSAFLDLTRRHPVLNEALLRSLVGVVRRLTGQASDFVFLDLEGRVAKALVQMADAQSEHDPAAGVLDLPLTQTDLARMVGGSRQSVNQILRSLAHRDYIELSGRTLVIKQPDLLRRRAGL